jgi:D-tyrosyl-tRNA(Tyr) deacylase
MRAVVQRVHSARVLVAGRVAGAIDRGLLVFVGVGGRDDPADVEYVAQKVRDLRIFPDEAGKMSRSVVEAAGAVLVVSQFTLYGDCRRGRRPSFIDAAPPEVANRLYEEVVASLRRSGVSVATGVFQADMRVELVNDGPVTILLDSKRGF